MPTPIENLMFIATILTWLIIVVVLAIALATIVIVIGLCILAVYEAWERSAR